MAARSRSYSVYLSNGETRSVEAPSLRQALNLAEKDAVGAEVICAMETSLLPPAGPAAMPFHVVLLRNPSFVAA